MKKTNLIAYLSIAFVNTFVDIGHKTLMLKILSMSYQGNTLTIFISIISAMMLLPYIMLFTPSGFIADRWPKQLIMRYTAFAAIPITLLLTLFYYFGLFWFSFIATLLLAIQSAINSPAKYGYIKETFGKSDIARINAYVQAIIIFSIVGSQAVFTYSASTLLPEKVNNINLLVENLVPLGIVLTLFATLEFLLTYKIPKLSAADPASTYSLKKYCQLKYLNTYLKKATENHIIFTCILGLAFFWAINQALLAIYTSHLTDIFGKGSNFAISSVGIAGVGILIGAGYTSKISRGFIETGVIPISALGCAIGILFLSNLHNPWFIAIALFIYGFFAGVLVVPLNALVQFHAKNQSLGKTLAANNFIQNVAMFSYLLIGILLTHYLSVSASLQLHILFILALIGTIASIFLLPQSLIRYLLYFIFSKFYRIEVTGLDNLPSTGGVLLLGNHVSFIDWAILQISNPRSIRFVMERSIFETWYLKKFFQALKIIPISPLRSKQGLKTIEEALNNGEVVCLFPEGGLTHNGQIGKIYSGFEKAIEHSRGVIVPFYLHGLWGTATSRAIQKAQKSSPIKSRNISVTYGKPLPATTNSAQLKQTISALASQAWYQSSHQLYPIANSWLKKAKKLKNEWCISDTTGLSLSNHMLIAVVMQFKRNLTPLFEHSETIGILLPPSVGGIAANLATWCAGKVVVNLNYTSSLPALCHAIKVANIHGIITSKLFIKKLTQKGLDVTALLDKITVHYLENDHSKKNRIKIFNNFILIKLLPYTLLEALLIKTQTADKIATILFSSGSEGEPKGVELTHRNLLINAQQAASVFNITDTDIFMATLPLFHAFGLTATTLLPLIEGSPLVCQTDPTDAMTLGRLIYKYKITLLFGASSLFGLYTRNKRLYPIMLKSIRLVIAGAEKVSPQVRQAFSDKFNLPIYEGYGATELSPVASCNLPNVLTEDDWRLHTFHKIGTVGLPLPGTSFNICDPDSGKVLPLGESGMIWVGGAQVMKGYLNEPEKTQQVLKEEHGIKWYCTGDKGYLDEDGFLNIVDRYSRFAKISGEMISLSLVENAILKQCNNEAELLVTAISDSKKGEKLVLLYNENTLNEEELKQAIANSELTNLQKPSQTIAVADIPKLGSGKKDFNQGNKLALEELNKHS